MSLPSPALAGRFCDIKMAQPLMKGVWQFLAKLNVHVIVQPSNCTLGYLSQKNENICSCKNLHTNVHRTSIHSSQELGLPGAQWLRFCPSSAGGTGSILGQETKEKNKQKPRSENNPCPSVAEWLNRMWDICAMEYPEILKRIRKQSYYSRNL